MTTKTLRICPKGHKYYRSTEEDLAKYSKSGILKLHGLGPSTIPKLEKGLSDKGLSFKKN